MTYVQLSADTTAVIGAFGGPQSGNAAVSNIADNDPRLLAFLAPASASATLSQKIAAGITITSTATPTLNATFGLDAVTMDQIGSVARDSASGLGLPGGGTTFTYPDIKGTPHIFTAAQIIAVYRAMRDAGLKKADLADRLGWPRSSVTRLFDGRHASRLDQIEAALKVLGRRLVVSSEAA